MRYTVVALIIALMPALAVCDDVTDNILTVRLAVDACAFDAIHETITPAPPVQDEKVWKALGNFVLDGAPALYEHMARLANANAYNSSETIDWSDEAEAKAAICSIWGDVSAAKCSRSGVCGEEEEEEE